MSFAETSLFYAVIGLAVAAGRWLVERPATSWGLLPFLPATVLFWPLFLPLLLARRADDDEPVSLNTPHDDLARAIDQVENELNTALAELDGGPESVLKQYAGRLRELRAALSAEADRIRQMERVLGSDPTEIISPEPAGNERERKSRLTRQENMQRLADLARRARIDLLTTLAWIRELVSMIHLAKFTGQPAARAEELVAQIAAAVESLSAATVARRA